MRPAKSLTVAAFIISHVDLFDAVQDTLNTFQLPESVLPAETCPTGFAETATVTLHLHTILNMDEGKLIKIVPAAMPGFLLDIAENALKEDAGLVADSGVELSRVLPVGYRKFLLKWFTRAITLVAYQVQKRDDKVADELMRFMLSKRGHDGLGASWWAQPAKKA